MNTELTVYCELNLHADCYSNGASCECFCHREDDDTFGGYATQDEYYDEWGWP